MIITIYDTVISSEEGDKVFEQPQEIKNFRRKNFSAFLLITLL